MSPTLTTALIFLNLIVFFLIGFPVGFSLIGLSILWLYLLHGVSLLQIVPATIFDTGTTEIFIAAPLFILMAIGLERSGIGSQLYEAIHKWTAGVPGGLAVGTVAAAAVIAAMTGIGGTAVLVLGVLAIPEMVRRGYDIRLAIGGLPPGGALGVLIPPTVVGVLLGGFAGIPVGHLFFGAAVPGVLCAALFCAYILVRCALDPSQGPAIPSHARPNWRERLAAGRDVVFPLLLIVLVLGSIWWGVATPSEAAGIGAFCTLLIGFVRRRIDFAALREIVTASGHVSVMVLTLLAGGALFSRLLQLSGSARLVADTILQIDAGVTGTLLIFIAIASILGMFIDAAAIVFIVTPIMMPVVLTLGIDPVWFGVLLMVAVAAGYVTPPFGMNLFYLRGIVDEIKLQPGCKALERVGFHDIWIACAPYVVLMYAALSLVVVFPELATWLPRQMR